MRQPTNLSQQVSKALSNLVEPLVRKTASIGSAIKHGSQLPAPVLPARKEHHRRSLVPGQLLRNLPQAIPSTRNLFVRECFLPLLKTILEKGQDRNIVVQGNHGVGTSTFARVIAAELEKRGQRYAYVSVEIMQTPITDEPSKWKNEACWLLLDGRVDASMYAVKSNRTIVFGADSMREDQDCYLTLTVPSWTWKEVEQFLHSLSHDEQESWRCRRFARHHLPGTDFGRAHGGTVCDRNSPIQEVVRARFEIAGGRIDLLQSDTLTLKQLEMRTKRAQSKRGG